MQARSPVRSTLELHRNKSLTVFSCDVVRWWVGDGVCLGFQRGAVCDVSSGFSQPGGKSSTVKQYGGAGSDTPVPSA